MGIFYLLLGYAIAIGVRLLLVFGTAWLLGIFWKSKHWTRVRTGIVIWVLVEVVGTIWFLAEFASELPYDELRRYMFGTVFAAFVYFSLWSGADDEARIEESNARKETEETFD